MIFCVTPVTIRNVPIKYPRKYREVRVRICEGLKSTEGYISVHPYLVQRVTVIFFEQHLTPLFDNVFPLHSVPICWFRYFHISCQLIKELFMGGGISPIRCLLI